MGRIKTTLLRRTGLKLFKEHEKMFNKDFAFNKKKVDELLSVRSKKLRNIIAGYVTRLYTLASKK